jgi:DnaD/phage-associated family protein
MNGYIVHGGQSAISLPAEEVRRLVQRADGDGALLYLYLQTHPGGVTAEALLQALKWSAPRLSAAEDTLRALNLLPAPAIKAPLAPPEEHPQYTREELSDMLESDTSFRALLPQIEEKLGKKLKTADLQILAGLYDDLGFPSDVLYLLVCHCIQRSEKRYGPGRKPTLRQIEKEGYYWQRRGLTTQESADVYLRQCARQEGQLGGYMHALQLGDRPPVDSEEKYLRSWIEMGFSPEAVALAYDRTVFYKKELKWSYLNGILRRWHENGCHTVEEIRAGDGRGKPAAVSGGERNDWMKQYTKK